MPRRLFRRRRPSLIALLVILIIIALRVGSAWNNDDDGSNEALVEGRYSLVRVVDGDTIIVAPAGRASLETILLDDGPEYRIRLLGIDTPETVKPNHPVEPWGPEATAFTRRFLAGGAVRLRFGRRRVDRYERYLAYVFVGDAMLNAALVREGLARVDVYPGDLPSLTRQLRAAQDEARDARRGLWSGTPPRL